MTALVTIYSTFVHTAVLLLSFFLAAPEGPNQTSMTPRLYAAVFLVRGSVTGSNRGEYGAFVREGTDSGWSRLSRSNMICFGLGYSGHGPRGRLYLAGGNGVHRSTDLGQTWKVLTGWRTEEILGIVPDPRDSCILFAATPFGVFHTSDDGVSWSPRNQGFRKTYVHRLLADTQDATTLFALAEDGIYRSVDGGKQWIPLGGRLTLPVALAQHPFDRRLLFAGVEEDGLWRSTDGGSSWAHVSDLGKSSVYAVRISPEGREVYAGGYATGLWRSTDGGTRWEQVPFAIECEAITAIYVGPSDRRHILVGTHGAGIYESTDEGATWRFAGLRNAIVKQIERYP